MSLKRTFSHVHTQDSPSNQWTIVHGLNCKPSVAVQILYNAQMQTALPNSVTYPDNNTVVVGFTAPYSGTARLF